MKHGMHVSLIYMGLGMYGAFMDYVAPEFFALSALLALCGVIGCVGVGIAVWASGEKRL